MSRAALVVLAALVAARAAEAAPRRHVDPEAIGEARRNAGERFASARAISHYVEARRAVRSGDVSKAAEHLRLAVTYDDRSAELRVSLAETLAESGQLEQADVEARRAVEQAQGGPSESEAHVLVGRIAA